MQNNLRALWGVLITIIAIMSGILSLVREVLQFVDPVRFPERSLFLASAQIAFLASVGFLWWQEKRARIVAETLLEKSKPHFTLELGPTLWHYRPAEDLTAFYLLASILNRGEPSVALNWRAQYILNGSVEQMEFYSIASPHTLTIGEKQITFTNENLTNLKALETPIQKGQWVGGRILCTVPGNRIPQLEAALFRIEVQCSDYTGASYSAKYLPHPAPLRDLIQHYNEQTAPAAGMPRPLPSTDEHHEEGPLPEKQ